MAKRLLLTLILTLAAGLMVNTVSAYQVEFYHAQSRSYPNADPGHFRVGFAIKDNDGNFVTESNKPASIDVTSQYTPTGGDPTELDAPFSEFFAEYDWANGGKTPNGWVYNDFTHENYYGAKYQPLTDAGSLSVAVDLNGVDVDPEEFSHVFDFAGYRQLTAPDISTLTKSYLDDGLLISWNPLSSSESGVSMRGILSGNAGGFDKEVQAYLDPLDAEMFIPTFLLNQMGAESDLGFQLQMRTDDGSNRYYTATTNVESMAVATPIPGAAWLLGSGLICLVGLKRKLKNKYRPALENDKGRVGNGSAFVLPECCDSSKSLLLNF